MIIMKDKVEYIRSKMEDLLIDMRDDRMFIMPGYYMGHGLVVREADGTDSSVIRLPTRMAIERVLDWADEWDALR